MCKHSTFSFFFLFNCTERERQRSKTCVICDMMRKNNGFGRDCCRRAGPLPSPSPGKDSGYIVPGFWLWYVWAAICLAPPASAAALVLSQNSPRFPHGFPFPNVSRAVSVGVAFCCVGSFSTTALLHTRTCAFLQNKSTYIRTLGIRGRHELTHRYRCRYATEEAINAQHIHFETTPRSD